MTSQLVYFSGGRSDDVTDYVLQQSQGSSSVTFQCRLPKPGLYKLQVQFLVIMTADIIILGSLSALVGSSWIDNRQIVLKEIDELFLVGCCFQYLFVFKEPYFPKLFQVRPSPARQNHWG